MEPLRNAATLPSLEEGLGNGFSPVGEQALRTLSEMVSAGALHWDEYQMGERVTLLIGIENYGPPFIDAFIGQYDDLRMQISPAHAIKVAAEAARLPRSTAHIREQMAQRSRYLSALHGQLGEYWRIVDHNHMRRTMHAPAGKFNNKESVLGWVKIAQQRAGYAKKLGSE